MEANRYSFLFQTSYFPSDFITEIINESPRRKRTGCQHQNQYRLYPNSAQTALHIEISIEAAFSLTISIHNTDAQCVKKLILQNNSNLSIDVSEISKGMYFLEIVDKLGHVELKKLVIE